MKFNLTEESNIDKKNSWYTDKKQWMEDYLKKFTDEELKIKQEILDHKGFWEPEDKEMVNAIFYELLRRSKMKKD